MGYSIITSSYMIVAIAGYWAFGFNVRPSFPGRIQLYIKSPVHIDIHRATAKGAFSKPARGDEFEEITDFPCAWPHEEGLQWGCEYVETLLLLCRWPPLSSRPLWLPLGLSRPSTSLQCCRSWGATRSTAAQRLALPTITCSGAATSLGSLGGHDSPKVLGTALEAIWGKFSP
jgi:hypothetical protein